MGSDADVEDELDDLELSDLSQKSVSLRASALRTLDDPGTFDGPVFPYWEDQPSDLKAFWHTQELPLGKLRGSLTVVWKS